MNKYHHSSIEKKDKNILKNLMFHSSYNYKLRIYLQYKLYIVLNKVFENFSRKKNQSLIDINDNNMYNYLNNNIKSSILKTYSNNVIKDKISNNNYIQLQNNIININNNQYSYKQNVINNINTNNSINKRKIITPPYKSFNMNNNKKNKEKQKLKKEAIITNKNIYTSRGVFKYKLNKNKEYNNYNINFSNNNTFVINNIENKIEMNSENNNRQYNINNLPKSEFNKEYRQNYPSSQSQTFYPNYDISSLSRKFDSENDYYELYDYVTPEKNPEATLRRNFSLISPFYKKNKIKNKNRNENVRKYKCHSFNIQIEKILLSV